MQLLPILQAHLSDTSLFIDSEVQALWSGYGQIIRCYSVKHAQFYIVKAVKPAQSYDHPRGWGGDVSHQRKLQSYQVESTFYQHYAMQTDYQSKVPTLLSSVVIDDVMLLIMEDLVHSGYRLTHTKGNQNNLAVAIKWLAYFHARFWQNTGEGLWSKGSYWHLATRQQEWQAMPESALKNHAIVIADKLASAKYITLLHGDAKFANLCFHENGLSVAAVDFQYIGRGAGVVDLAYLLGSCLSDDALFSFESFALSYYQQQLTEALNFYNIQFDKQALMQEINALYPLAWADFYRFLLGWNPDSWKNGEYIKAMTSKALKQL